MASGKVTPHSLGDRDHGMATNRPVIRQARRQDSSWEPKHGTARCDINLFFSFLFLFGRPSYSALKRLRHRQFFHIQRSSPSFRQFPSGDQLDIDVVDNASISLWFRTIDMAASPTCVPPTGRCHRSLSTAIRYAC